MSMNKHQVKGRVTEVRSMIKEAAGHFVDSEMEENCWVEKVLGETGAKVGDIRQDVKDAVRKA